jgi:hypothetical protein
VSFFCRSNSSIISPSPSCSNGAGGRETLAARNSN